MMNRMRENAAPLLRRVTYCKQRGITRALINALLGGALALASMTVYAGDEPLLDCPLRDAPFSVDSPLLDLMLSPRAKAILEGQFPGILEKLPAHMMRTETPSFAAIMTVESLLGMMRLPTDGLADLDKQLAKLEVTDADRRARCARYDNDAPEFVVGDEAVQVLVFTKINGFDHGPSVVAATDAIEAIADELGWGVAVSNKGGAFTPETLSRFDVVVWNNISGDALTLSQREAFKDYIEQGGGFLGIHGSGGDSVYFWDWYRDTLLGAQFTGHPMEPQFQDADVHVEKNASGIGASLAPGWTMNDEWYSFEKSPRSENVTVIATLDESTYSPEGFGGQDLRMGEDHPIVWSRCIGQGRSLYSAIGHRPEVYEVAENMSLLKDGLVWVAGQGKSPCLSGK